MSGWNSKQIIAGWRRKKIKTWQLALAFVILLFLSVYLLRQNNLKMIELRSAVVIADKQGKGVEESIKELNHHIFAHMNTTTIRPVELVYTYNREAERAIKAASSKGGKDVYAEAARACERQGVPLTSVAQCAAQYATKNQKQVGPAKINLPDKSLFTYSFASPRWTPDLAGITVLLTVVTGVWLTFRVVEFLVVRVLVHRRLKGDF